MRVKVVRLWGTKISWAGISRRGWTDRKPVGAWVRIGFDRSLWVFWA